LQIIPETPVLEGVILIDKPSGCTSHHVVDTIRRKLRIKKVGHCGTLDPAATGLLIILLGKATKLSDLLMGEDKIYTGSFLLGETTDSYDADGTVISTAPVPSLTLTQIQEFADTLAGDQLQQPPMVSAIKVNGVPLHKLARKGIEVERKPRLIYVYQFKIQTYKEPSGTFIYSCTKGAYVRSAIFDLGNKIGCGAHLTGLRRLKSGSFEIKDAIPLDKFMEMTPEQIAQKVIPIQTLTHLHG